MKIIFLSNKKYIMISYAIIFINEIP